MHVMKHRRKMIPYNQQWGNDMTVKQHIALLEGLKKRGFSFISASNINARLTALKGQPGGGAELEARRAARIEAMKKTIAK